MKRKKLTSKEIQYNIETIYHKMSEILPKEEEIINKFFGDEKTISFMPKHHKNGIRLEIMIDKKDYEKHREAARGEWTKIKDITHNTDILVQQADCGFDCYCDAIYKLID